MSISDQVFADHAHKARVDPGEFIEADIDLVMVHEQLGGRIAPEYEKLEKDRIWDPSRVFFILDHWVPPPDVKAAKMHQIANRFADKYHFQWNMGQNKGICHQVLPEMGFSRPGMLIAGSDSHTTTYGAFNCLGIGIGASDVTTIFDTGRLWFKVPETIRIELTGKLGPKSMGKDVALYLLGLYKTDGAIYESMEFGGPGLGTLSIDARMTISNMAVEMGAKCGVFEGDKSLSAWLAEHPIMPNFNPRADSPNGSKDIERGRQLSEFIQPADSAVYKAIQTIALDEIPPLVAKPFSPDNVVPVEEVGDIEIDQAFIGSCTNGRLEDLRIAAKILRGSSVHPRVKLIIIPASREIYLAAMKEGLLEIFVQAGAMVEYPTCGPCIGGHLGVLGPQEVCVSTTNRNFKGRMGDPSSQTYLASPAIAAASAIAGKIMLPKNSLW